MTIQELFIASNQELRKVIDQIKKDQWDLDMPQGASSKPSTLKESVRYHTYDDAWVPDVLEGKTKEEVGEIYEPLLTSDDVLKNYDLNNERAIIAVRDFTKLDRTTHLSYGDFPARDYLQHIISFRAFRAYDIAKLIGVEYIMPDNFIEALTEEFTPVIDTYRKMGVFPPAVEVSDDASSQAKLLAMVGRG